MTTADGDAAPPHDGGPGPSAPRSYEPRTARQLQVMALQDTSWQRLAGFDSHRLRSYDYDGFPLRISVFVSPTTVLVKLRGDLDYWTGPLLGGTVARLADAPSEVVVDLAQVGFLDGGGIRSLLGARAQIGPGRFRLGASSPTVHRLLTLVGLTELMEAGGTPVA